MAATLVLSFNGYTFADHDFIAIPGQTDGAWTITPNIEMRQGAAPLFTGATVSERAYPVKLIYKGTLNTRLAMNALVGALDPIGAATDPRTLIIRDPDGVEMSCLAVVQVLSPDDENAINVIDLAFITVDPFWTKTTATSTGATTINAASPTMTVLNAGATTVYPEIVRSPPTSTFTATQSSQRVITITNDSDMPLERETIIIKAGTSATIAEATILKDGTYYPVSALTGNTGNNDYFAFPGSIDAGESEDYLLIGTTNPIGTLDRYTRFDGNYSALDLSFYRFTATAGSASTITVSTASWVTNEWAGACLCIISGSGITQRRMVLSNTATVLTVARNFTTNPSSSSIFVLVGTGIYMDGGRASSGSSTVLTDSSQSWDADTLIGGVVQIYSGTGSPSGEITITDNTATAITVANFPVTPDNTSTYYVTRPFYHRYQVQQEKPDDSRKHWGGWQSNKRYTRPSKLQWGEDVLNSWEPFLLLRNNDDFNQSRACPITISPGDVDYFPILDADRRKGQDRLLQEEGQADGVSIYHPWGYMGIRFDYQQKNPNSATGATKGICKFVLAGREVGGDEFEFFIEDDTRRTSLTAVAEQFVNLTDYGNPEQLYMGQVPFDEVEVDSTASDTDTATVRWGSTLRLWVDMEGKFEPTFTNVQTVIPVEDEIRVGDYALQIGMRNGQRLWLRSTGDELHLDCANARAWIDNGGTITDVTYAVHPLIYEDRDGDGTEESYLADRWLPIPPGSNTLEASGDPWATNGAFTLTLDWSEKVYG